MRAVTLLALVLVTWAADPGRVLDGDTFEANVMLWPGLTAQTKVRILGIDTPELFRPRCESERTLAIEAKKLTETWLSARAEVVYLRAVREDVYAGRVDAEVLDAAGESLGAALVASGLAKRTTGTRATWCPQ